MQLADIFAWDIDFALSLRKGDMFTVVYEKSLLKIKKLIVATSFLPSLSTEDTHILLSGLKIKTVLRIISPPREKVCAKPFTHPGGFCPHQLPFQS